MYNKHQEVIEKKKKHEFGNKNLIHTRIEFRKQNKNTNLGLKNAYKYKNPFIRMRLFDSLKSESTITQYKWLDDHVWSWFFDSCNYRGMETSLRAVIKQDRKILMAALDHAEDGVWRPEQLWGLWKETLDNSGLFNPPS